MNIICKGCNKYRKQRCSLTLIGQANKCICKDCLVKVMCKERCYERIKQYEDLNKLERMKSTGWR
jgi:hypothetical protein